MKILAKKITCSTETEVQEFLAKYIGKEEVAALNGDVERFLDAAGYVFEDHGYDADDILGKLLNFLGNDKYESVIENIDEDPDDMDTWDLCMEIWSILDDIEYIKFLDYCGILYDI